MEKLLWPTHWFWYKTLQRNKKVNKRTSEDYTTGYLLEYEWAKNHCRLVEVSRQKEVNADPKALRQKHLLGN